MILNRKIIQSALNDYMRQALAGLWELVPDCILYFTKDGMLLNGQHRVEMVIRTGIAVPIIVCRGVPATLFSKMDTGRKWQPKDILSVDNWERPKDVAAIAKIIVQFYQGTAAQNSPETNDEILKFTRANIESLRESCLQAFSLRYQKVVMGALPYIYARIDRAKADEFIRDFREGNAHGTPGAIGKQIIDDAKALWSVRIDSRHVLAWAFVAFNAHFLGRRVTKSELLAAQAERKYEIDPALLFGRRQTIPSGITVTE